MIQPARIASSCFALAAVFLLGAVPCQAAEKKLTIAVIPKGTTHEFWQAVHAGAVKAERELNQLGRAATVLWKGPLREDDRDQQIQVVENFMTRRVDGIVLAPLDSQALIRPVTSAMKSRIPVVIFDSGLKSDDYVSFVATDNLKGGRMAGDHLGKLLGGKGKVILLRYAVGSASTEAREAGFLAALKENFPGITLLSADQYAGATRETSYQASQNLLNRFGKEVDGIFCPNENSTVGMAMALRNIDRAGGKVKMIGFDAGTASVEDLRKGDVQGLIVQNPFRMGYLGVMTLVQHLDGKVVEKRIDTGVQLVTKENMEQPEIRDLLHPPIKDYVP